MAYLYPYGDTQQLNLDWLIEQWNEVKSQIDGSLQAEIDRVEAAITDLLTARDEAVAAQTAAQASAQAAAGSASTASGAASTATAQAQAAAGSAATAGAHASDAQGYAATAQQAAQAANNSAGAAAVSEGNARNSETAAAGSSSAAAGNALYAEGYAKGTQNGNPVSSGSPYYENNAKYYSDQAAQDASDAADAAQDAQDAAALIDMPATSADIGKAIIVKTVADGKVSEYEFGEAGGGGGAPAFIQTIENVPIASFKDGINSPIQELLAEVTADAGATGWTSADITITGKNLLNLSADKMISYSWNRRFPIEFKEAGTYIISAQNQFGPASQRGAAVNLLDENYQQVLSLVGYTFGADIFSATFTLNTRYRDVKYIQFAFTTSGTTFADIEIGHIQVEKGTVVTAYENFGSITTITFPTEAGEVTSGTIDAIAKTLTVGANVYPLTIPDLNTLSGENNIWINTGNINKISYLANSKTYIDEKDAFIKALIAIELPDMTADTALVANDFRIVNNTLYRITASVASGGTLTPGTNCTATTISAVLKSLLS